MTAGPNTPRRSRQVRAVFSMRLGSMRLGRRPCIASLSRPCNRCARHKQRPLDCRTFDQQFRLPEGSTHAMTDKPAGATTRVARIIKAPPEPLYAAFVDSDVLIRWLPPAEMTGEIRDFDARVGGGYRLSLFYPPGERAFLGKTTEREDRMTVRFLELEPPRRIVEAVTFDSADPAFLGQMTIVVRAGRRRDGRRV